MFRDSLSGTSSVMLKWLCKTIVFLREFLRETCQIFVVWLLAGAGNINQLLHSSSGNCVFLLQMSHYIRKFLFSMFFF